MVSMMLMCGFLGGTSLQYGKSKTSHIIGRVLQVISVLAMVIYLVSLVVRNGLY